MGRKGKLGKLSPKEPTREKRMEVEFDDDDSDFSNPLAGMKWGGVPKPGVGGVPASAAALSEAASPQKSARAIAAARDDELAIETNFAANPGSPPVSGTESPAVRKRERRYSANVEKRMASSKWTSGTDPDEEDPDAAAAAISAAAAREEAELQKTRNADGSAPTGFFKLERTEMSQDEQLGGISTNDILRDDELGTVPPWFQGQAYLQLDRPIVATFATFLSTIPLALAGLNWLWGAIEDDDTEMAMWSMSILGLSLAFYPLCAAFRNAVRPGFGALSVLTSEDTRLSTASLRKLQLWRAGCRLCTLCSIAFGFYCFVLFFMGKGIGFLTFGIWLIFAIGLVFSQWFLALQVCAELATSAIRTVRDEMQDQGSVLYDDDEWQEKVRHPALELAEIILPTLSSFGPSLAAIFFSMLAFGLCTLHFAFSASSTTADWVIGVAMTVLPATLLLLPAWVSTECKILSNDLNSLRKSDVISAEAASRIDVLEAFLNGCNYRQGLGFAIGGLVVTTTELRVLLIKLYSVIATVTLILQPQLPSLPADSSVTVACAPGFYHLGNGCYKLMTETLSWPDAQSACKQQYGSNLAIIESSEQNAAVLQLASSLLTSELGGSSVVWLGMTDAMEENSWVWVDGEDAAARYENWGSDQPIGGDPRPAGTLPACGSYQGRDCALMDVFTGQWRSAACDVDETSWDGLMSPANGKPSCYAVTLPFICSLPLVPAKARGGPMLGCRGGGWMMGTPHNNSETFYVTEAYGTHNTSEYTRSMARTAAIQNPGIVTTEAECVSLVRRLHPKANGAVFSNVGGVWCQAVFNASGVVFEPAVQSCLFDESSELCTQMAAVATAPATGCPVLNSAQEDLAAQAASAVIEAVAGGVLPSGGGVCNYDLTVEL